MFFKQSTGQAGGFNLSKVCILAVVIGVLAGIAAELLHQMIGIVTNLVFYQRISTHIDSPLESPLGIFIIVVPAIGGLVIGLMARYGTPLVRGHGIPEAMEAVLLKGSRIHPKVAILKPISAAISIGSGQPFGAEGPIIQTGAALGSILGQLLHTTIVERKVLLASGSAAGLAATFGTPVAAVIFAIELLLFEFRTRSFIPIVIASTIATAVHIVFLGSAPVFSIGVADFGNPLNLVFFLLLGALCGGLASLLTAALYKIEDFYHRLKISTYLWPALGGLFVGVVGYIVPHFVSEGVDVFGPGYTIIGNILQNDYAIGFLLVLLVSKAAVWLVALGSGTSGGVLAPVFMIGAAFGAIFGLILQQLFPAMDAAPVAFAMAGMAAVFGSSTRATFASIVFAFEMTQRYEAILPVMLTCVVADVVVTRLMKSSILTEQLRRNGILISHEYEADVLDMISVRSVMTEDPVTIPSTMIVQDLITKINQRDPRLTRHQALLIVDEQDQLSGIITRGDIVRAIESGRNEETVLEAGTNELSVAYEDESVREALTRMLTIDVGRMPVVTRNDSKKVTGYLSRGNIMSTYLKKIQEETLVESGWVRNRFKAKVS
jgi:CIC family chloride channel protein